jgi:hypothetical protein
MYTVIVLIRIGPSAYRGVQYTSDSLPDSASIHARWRDYGVTVCGVYDVPAATWSA